MEINLNMLLKHLNYNYIYIIIYYNVLLRIKLSQGIFRGLHSMNISLSLPYYDGL